MSASPIRVIVVDDHQILREGVRSLLASDPGTPAIEVVGEASNGFDGLALLLDRPDVAVLDLAMPGKLGTEVCQAARAQGVRVVVLTMHVSSEHVRQAREAGANGYVVKGSGVSQLAGAIRQVAAGKDGPFPSAAADDLLASLSPRQKEVLVEVASGYSNRQIALRLGISVHTVNTHRINLMSRLEVHDAVSLARVAIKFGLLP